MSSVLLSLIGSLVIVPRSMRLLPLATYNVHPEWSKMGVISYQDVIIFKFGIKFSHLPNFTMCIISFSANWLDFSGAEIVKLSENIRIFYFE